MILELFTVDELARRLTDPSPIDYGFFSGVFVQVETADEGAFLLRDLAMVLKSSGFQVVEFRGRDLSYEQALTSIASLIDAAVSYSDFGTNFLTARTLADFVTAALETRGETMALLIDGAQALLGKSGAHVMQALKSARDAANLNPGQRARLLVVATCLQPARVEHFVSDPHSAFFGAAAIAVAKLSS